VKKLLEQVKGIWTRLKSQNKNFYSFNLCSCYNYYRY